VAAPVLGEPRVVGQGLGADEQRMLDDLKRFVKGGLPAPLAEILSPAEQQALLVRAQALADYARFPEDRSGHRYLGRWCEAT